MKKITLTKELVIKNMTLDDFKKNIRENYSFEKEEKIMEFKWGEIEEKEINFFKNGKAVKLKFNSTKATISSYSYGEINKKQVSVLIKEEEDNLRLIIKGDDAIRKKIKSKLLGKYTSIIKIKNIWEKYEVEEAKQNLALEFLLWIINKYKRKETLEDEEFEFRIYDIFYLADNGISLNIKRIGQGSEITSDPIIKAIISAVETINSIGAKITFKGGEVSFILCKTGEIQVDFDYSNTDVRQPIKLYSNSDEDQDKIIFFIKEIIEKKLIILFEKENKIKLIQELNKMKSEYLVEMILDLKDNWKKEFLIELIDKLKDNWQEEFLIELIDKLKDNWKKEFITKLINKLK